MLCSLTWETKLSNALLPVCHASINPYDSLFIPSTALLVGMPVGQFTIHGISCSPLLRNVPAPVSYTTAKITLSPFSSQNFSRATVTCNV